MRGTQEKIEKWVIPLELLWLQLRFLRNERQTVRERDQWFSEEIHSFFRFLPFPLTPKIRSDDERMDLRRREKNSRQEEGKRVYHCPLTSCSFLCETRRSEQKERTSLEVPWEKQYFVVQRSWGNKLPEKRESWVSNVPSLALPIESDTRIKNRLKSSPAAQTVQSVFCVSTSVWRRPSIKNPSEEQTYFFR